MSDGRILVVMPNWFGDTLFATPVVSALRRARPLAFIAAMGVARCQDVLAHNPHLNEFVLYEERGAHASLAGKRRLISQLRAMRLDTACVLRKSFTRSLMLAAAGIPRRIGFDHWKSRWVLTDRVVPPPDTMHKALTYLRLLQPLGVPVLSDVRGEYFVSPQEQDQAAAFLRDAGLEPPFVVLHPGANWFHKQWPVERFAQLADRLARTHRVALTGSPDDVGLVRSIQDRMTSPPAVLAGRTSLRLLAACLERASLLVSNDTGVLHIACALGRPVVALYGPTSPALTGPLGDSARTIVIHHAESCPRIPCLQPDHAAYPGMAAITVDEVAQAAARLMHGVNQWA